MSASTVSYSTKWIHTAQLRVDTLRIAVDPHRWEQKRMCSLVIKRLLRFFFSPAFLIRATELVAHQLLYKKLELLTGNRSYLSS